ncbi:hypothetical protein C7H84_09540 [Burkholderia sp. Nafp2/4-1b]|uniref:replication protein n=1 Tax=Burkholderia sp. Nafp2/4-1b TaxID=2116686 RepID=UPI000EF8C97F|nr:replication protein [Burkholderia sp. Nafp2/4-1b]RKU03371.1 hypothetical protein C7H84_09540 [Burkholderia sp. Nafp2/4-1b]
MALAEVIHMPESRSPQCEQGYTRIANELLEAITLAPFTQNQYKVILTVWRMTYGFNKRADQLSLSQIVARTGLEKAQASRAVSQLIEMHVLLADDGRHARMLSLNKVYSQWASEVRVTLPSWGSEKPRDDVTEPMAEGCENHNFGAVQTLSKGCENHNLGVVELTTKGCESHNSRVVEFTTTKDIPKRHNQKTTPKENLLRTLGARFEIFWTAYPKKKSKATAEKAFAKLNPDEQLFDDLMAGLERAKTSAQWRNPQFIPYAATWLRAGGWMDEVQTEYSDAELAMIRAYNEALGEQVGTIDESVFVESRAAAIRDFASLRPHDPDFWRRYFPWVAANVDIPPKAGFDWLISREGFTKVKGGQHTRRTGQ